MEQVTVSAPGSVSNLGSGFDVLGFALEEPCDALTLRFTDTPGVRLVNESPYPLPDNPEQNVSGVVLLAVLQKTGAGRGFELTVRKRIKPGSGIGSSAASAAGAAVAAATLLGSPFSKLELLDLAMEGEVIASGARHADNVAPCIYGGVTLIRSLNPVDIIALPSADLHVTIVHPQIEIKTSDARAVLRPDVPLKEAIRQWGNLGALVAGFYRNDPELIGRSMEDVVAEPYRKALIPGFDAVRAACVKAGALGGGISGSGPSLFQFSRTKETAQQVADAMSHVYQDLGIAHYTYVTRINPDGVRVLETS
ncbi:homoserine kinase [Flaviaesturariibacter aridisoli]|uniref:Homoserine kinase n=1 Tax=Flaviaesturariibacter aridisoli TaxID=2545761 RepID=A0A4R4DW61_9BACT|nr:homoserine kinase [Flaviaesturariibacter aridisoli]TCZ68320.1 homoserine kinase [Flaviaesturariibacter aridisoli]